jgi:hypothetical protein
MDAAFKRALERIHPRLREHPELRYTVVLNGHKAPVGQRWTTDANYAYGNPALAGYLAEGHNYGVMTGIGDIVVFDGDDINRLESLGIVQQLPDTLLSRTGRGGHHYFMFCAGLKDRIVLEDPELEDSDGDPLHLGEIQALGQQVVGPGSIHPNGNRYEVIHDAPIATITKDELLKILETLADQESGPGEPQKGTQEQWKVWRLNWRSYTNRSSGMAERHQREIWS